MLPSEGRMRTRTPGSRVVEKHALLVLVCYNSPRVPPVSQPWSREPQVPREVVQMPRTRGKARLRFTWFTSYRVCVSPPVISRLCRWLLARAETRLGSS